MALSKAAQEYLMALETERQKVEKEKGADAAKAYVDDQKRKGQNFRDADVRSAKIDPNSPVVKAARRRLQNDKPGRAKPNESKSGSRTGTGMFNGMPSFNPNNATVGQGSPKQSPAEKAASGRRDMDSIRRQNAMDRKKQEENKPPKKSDVYNARQRAAEYARNK